jgi:hypothetical protein
MPDNNDKTKPINVSFGNALGEWENEFDEDEWIDEIIVAGAKSYSYITNKGKIQIRMKGITLDRATSDIFTFERIRKMVLENDTLESAERFQFIWNSNREIETRPIKRKVRNTMDSKRIVLDNHFTLPFGYEI